jgi:phosphoribosylformylglycinamidine cyclo-ligase
MTASGEAARPGLDYARAGVDTAREEEALAGLLAAIRPTLAARRGVGAPLLGLGHFANVIAVGENLGIAVSTDGVGTKLLVAQLLDRYDTIGIDCVAMNVNDVLCVGAEPVCLLDYIAVQEPDPVLLAEIGRGLARGAALANVTIPGGEIAQAGEIIRGVRAGRGFDLVGTCLGTVRLDRIIDGRAVEPGDVVVGLRSSGVHSNGLTLARRALLDGGRCSASDPVPGSGQTVGAALLEPTRIYVREVLELRDAGVRLKGLAHITGDGLSNLGRIGSGVTYVLDALPEPQPIFGLIQRAGGVSDEEMYTVFNMGVGFCLVVEPDQAEAVIRIAARHGSAGSVIGHVAGGPGGEVRIPGRRLVARGNRFRPE